MDRMDRRLDRMDGRLDRMDRLTDSQRGMVKNGLLAAGGSEDSGNSYKPICNDNGEYPGETSYIQEIISLDQINSMTSSTLDLYLNFYNLGRNRLIAEKKGKLIRFLGINERVMITQKTTHGATPC
ncbi:uncharacterized protein PRCAT00004760001 [Priceomyces carsonii]|uniref:uncharacterized protein n=1 Tax=Priceomyces carsonii TaxID=28549 RepID=UPI002EDA0620|nr:unnamed protein product [Priceomyces carsonii]